MKKIISVCVVMIIALGVITGCRTVSRFVYPADKDGLYQYKGESIITMDKTVAVVSFEDMRGDEKSAGKFALFYLPLAPYGTMSYDRPEEAQQLLMALKYECNPAVDFAKATVVSMQRSKIFKGVKYVSDIKSANCDFVVSGEIYAMKYTGKWYSYGLSILGGLMWDLGLPQGHSENEIVCKINLKDAAGNILWSYNIDKKDGWTYNHYSDGLSSAIYIPDEDCKAFSSLMQSGLNDALADLVQSIKNNLGMVRQ